MHSCAYSLISVQKIVVIDDIFSSEYHSFKLSLAKAVQIAIHMGHSVSFSGKYCKNNV